MSVEHRAKKPRLPPRWFIRLAWSVHRGVYRATRGRIGLWRPRAHGWGTLRLIATGRRSGRERSVIIGYFEDGPNLVSLAMNGWGEGETAWWLNLQAHPDATVDLVGGRRMVRAHAATGDERSRLWARWREIDSNLDVYAARRPSETAVVVLELRSGESDTSRDSGSARRRPPPQPVHSDEARQSTSTFMTLPPLPRAANAAAALSSGSILEMSVPAGTVLLVSNSMAVS